MTQESKVILLEPVADVDEEALRKVGEDTSLNQNVANDVFWVIFIYDFLRFSVSEHC